MFGVTVLGIGIGVLKTTAGGSGGVFGGGGGGHDVVIGVVGGWGGGICIDVFGVVVASGRVHCHAVRLGRSLKWEEIRNQFSETWGQLKTPFLFQSRI